MEMNIDPTELSWLTLLARHPLRSDRAEFDANLTPEGRQVADILGRRANGDPVDQFPQPLVDLADSLLNWANANPDPTPAASASLSEDTLTRVRQIAVDEAWGA